MIKKFKQKNGRFPTSEDIERLCLDISTRAEIAPSELLRNYFYHARPASGVITNPFDQSRTDLSSTLVHSQHESLLDRLELAPNFSVRLGETVANGWRLGSSAMTSLRRTPRSIQAADFVPDITQKGVDLRIGMDIARLSLREMVSVIVVVTGDSDLIPAFKFARREGVRVYLECLGHGVRRDLKAHADMVFEDK
ncbi:MAG: NYN domain-containing protein [Pseudomonadota bacterium]|nr:NYN domain-containing protein [Pseudomonadota bacterium]